MTWTRTGDDFPDQLYERSDAAYRLFHAALTYANRLGLDGRIPKGRLSSVPVPQRTRRPAIVAELVDHGLWALEDDAWTIVGFFDAQPSAEEVAATRHYDAVRQRKRFASDDETRRVLAAEEAESKRALFDARERRRARASQRESQRDSQRPLPTSPRPDPSIPKDEVEAESRDVPNALGERRPALDDGGCPNCFNPLRGDEIASPFDGVVRLWHRDCLEFYRRSPAENQGRLSVGDRMAAIFEDAS